MKPLRSIQVLRAIAALGVLMFHACQWSGADFAVGAAGVDLFFLISGFVLWLGAEPTPVSPGAFLWARAVRVAPLYWLWTLLTAALALGWPALMPVVHVDLRHLLLSMAFLPHADPLGGPFPLLPSGWTLTYEALFYLAFALALTWSRERRFQVLATILTICALMGFAYHRWYTLLANPLLLEFVAGAALARAWRSGRFAGPGSAGFAWFAIALGGALLGAQQIAGVRSDFWRPIIWGAPACLILAGSLRLETAGIGRGPIGRGLGRIGDASYSLYLCQIPVTLLVFAATPAMVPAARVVLTLAVALAVGLACHAWVERPLTGVLRRARGPGRIRPQTLGPGPVKV